MTFYASIYSGSVFMQSKSVTVFLHGVIIDTWGGLMPIYLFSKMKKLHPWRTELPGSCYITSIVSPVSETTRLHLCNKCVNCTFHHSQRDICRSLKLTVLMKLNNVRRHCKWRPQSFLLMKTQHHPGVSPRVINGDYIADAAWWSCLVSQRDTSRTE